jgi:ABC-type branched-subunit amino acid transport system substrate-binding protein
MKKLLSALAFLFVTMHSSYAQEVKPVTKIYRVAIFAPLFLDSAFDNSFYKYGKSFPKFAHPGFDFVQGAKIALDSLPLPKGSIEARIFDCKSEQSSINWLLKYKKLDSIDLIIGSVKDIELTLLAAFAKQKNIPFVSATSPNDASVVDNPFMIMVQSSLRAHCEAIYSYLLQNHGTDKIYLCRKKGNQEDKIAEYFKNINEGDGKPILNIQTLNFETDFAELKTTLDSTTKSIIIGGSLNDDFATGLVNTCYEMYNNYALDVIGMPNWESFGELKKATLKDFPILFTASYNNPKTDILSRKLQSAYNKKFKTNPSEMSYKGFEAVYVFAKLLTKYPDDYMSHLNESNTKVFSEFNFKPTYVNKKNPMPDYFENKHLYFLKLLNGKVSRAF